MAKTWIKMLKRGKTKPTKAYRDGKPLMLVRVEKSHRADYYGVMIQSNHYKAGLLRPEWRFVITDATLEDAEKVFNRRNIDK